ncbi:hypothetical protein H9Q72_003503 [Fusarium xylarioides]|uniref:Uncharacterized protein n=1 Tax=Fusarium xylarioides TaxID=221167 RepID=A0A9P7HXR0_9HYPO|nr:hypothetical protein H9Q70_010491 [Fusarium xylarioides]KAG5769160.1 hypothetical protein H9Q72_003503 [Fusarium xylarioides]KAG5775538.1 hypothetical protein H9Q73_010802 [Fusarium xylarioides]
MPLDSSGVISLPLEVHSEDSGTVRTDIVPTVAQAQAAGFYVDFKIVYEIHGSFDQGDYDNASLLGVRIFPFPKDSKKRFEEFEVKLTVLADQDSPDEIPQLKSFEPAHDGEQFVDAFTTTESLEVSKEISGELKPWEVASLGAKRTSARKSEFTQTHHLSVKAWPQRSSTSLPLSIHNRAKWKITPATKEQGIGDCFSVSLLIWRPSGAKFRLVAEVSGNVGSRAENSKEWLKTNLQGKRSPSTLGTFPSDNVSLWGDAPPGVDSKDLHRASTTGLMSKFNDIGLHLPEHAPPLKFNQTAASATYLNLGSDNTAISKKDRPEEPCATLPSDTPTTDVLLPSILSNEHPAPPAPEPVDHSDAAAVSQYGIPDNVQLTGVNTDDLLVALLQRLQRMRTQLPTPNLDVNRNEKTAMTRVQRHRKMAHLYEQLAELHREEAREYLPREDKDQGV